MASDSKVSLGAQRFLKTPTTPHAPVFAGMTPEAPSKLVNGLRGLILKDNDLLPPFQWVWL